MGLDMYANRMRYMPSKEVDFKDEIYDRDENGYLVDKESIETSELFYWRKHPNLHGWMENLYYEKGGTSDSFNCVPLVLTSSDLDRLEKDLKENLLPQTEGFFFGESDPDRIHKDLEFIQEARKAIEEGDTVYYDSWW
jgi:hypothetical protein